MFRFSQRSWGILATVLLISAGYAFYFFVYVKQKKVEYDKKAYRVLNRIAENIVATNENFEGNIRILSREIENIKLKERTVKAERKKKEKEIRKLRREIGGIQRKIDVLESPSIQKINYFNRNKKREKRKSKGDSLILEMFNDYTLKKLRLEEKLDSIQAALNSKRSSNLESAIKALSGKYKLNLIDSSQYILLKEDASQIVYHENGSSTSSKIFQKDMASFLEPILKYNFFNEFIVLRDTQVAFQSFGNRIEINANEDSTIFTLNNGFVTGNSRNIIINDEQYHAYIHKLEFVEGKYWTLIGCIPESQYVNATRNINSWLILYASLFILVLIVSMPVLKLAVMSSIERLHMNNVFLIGLSIVVGSPLIILSLMIIYSYFGSDMNAVDKRLKWLSREVNNRFTEEIADAFWQLKTYDESILKYAEKKWPLAENKTGSVSHILQDSNNFEQRIYPYFNEVFWLDKDGNQTIQLNAKPDTNTLVNLSKRDYYQNVIMNKFWSVPDTALDDQFVMQSIISWTTMENEVAISKKCQPENGAVAVITSKLSSVMEPVVPAGFGFAFVDQSGDVLFHSVKDRVLQENFFEESENNHLLKAAVAGHTFLKLNIRYHGSEHRVFVNPLNNIPLTVLVYYDLELLKTKISEIWFFALLLMLLSFFNASLFILVKYFTRKESRNLEFQNFLFNWLTPHPKHGLLYKKMLISHIAAAFLLVISSSFFSEEVVHEVFRVIMTPSIIFCMVYINFHVSINKRFPRKFAISSALLLIFINLIHEIIFTLYFADYFYQIFLILIYSVPIRFQAFDPQRHTDYIKPYHYMLLVWLVATSLLPVYIYYNTAHAQETEIWSKFELLEHVKDRKQYEETAYAYLNELPKKQLYPQVDTSDLLFRKKMTRGVYWKYDDSLNLEQMDKVSSYFDTLLFYIRPNFKKHVNDTRGLVFSKSGDQFFEWSHYSSDDQQIIQINEKSEELIGQPVVKTLEAKMALDDMTIIRFWKNPMAAFLLGLMSFGFGVFLFHLIRFASNQVYALDKVFLSKASINGKKQLKALSKEKNVLLLGPANSGRTSFIKSAIGKSYEYVNCIEMRDDAACNKQFKSLSTTYKETVLVDNFEYEMFNHSLNQKKLRVLETLMSSQKSVIVVSEIDPDELIKHLQEAIKKETDITKRETFESDLHIWRHIFSGFIRVFKPFEKVAVNCKFHNAEINKLAENELCHGTYLRHLLPVIHSKNELLTLKADEAEILILEIEELAQPYYMALWNTLTKEERFVVYDVAKDGFVNVKNKQAILSLLKKGVLINKRNIQLFNESFRNFVLVTNKEEALVMEKEMKKKGKWANIRTILILITISLIALIGFGQPGFFKNINSIVLALTGIASLLPTFNNLFSFSQKFKTN